MCDTLSVININKKYHKKVLSSFSYEFKTGKIYSIVGQSGSGKSTLLSILSNNIQDYRGNVYFNNINIKKLKNYTFKNVGYVFQNYQLFDSLTAYENVILYFKIINEDLNKFDYKIKLLFKQFKISHIINQKVKYLSGGERQRVSLIKAFIKEPKILLLDEPTSALDKKNALLLLNYLHRIKKDKIVILVTHDLSLANSCDEIVKINEKQHIKLVGKERNYKEKKIKFYYLKEIYKKVFSSKKIISYISTTILSFGLISISLSFVIKDFINDIIDASLTTFDTSKYITFKSQNTYKRIDFNEEIIDDFDYIYYEGIASNEKKIIKENSVINETKFNEFNIENTNFVFDNYLSQHKDNFVLYIPSYANDYVKKINNLTISFQQSTINIKIDEVYQSYDDNFYIYCNNISYMKSYFIATNITYRLNKYIYCDNASDLYDYLMNSDLYLNYLFDLNINNNIIQILENSECRISQNQLDIFINENSGEYLLSDYIHTYIDYQTGLIYLLLDENKMIQIVIDDSLNETEVGLSYKMNEYYSTYDKVKIFDKFFEKAYISEEENYTIVYMNKNVFKSINNDVAYCGLLFVNNKNEVKSTSSIIVNKDLFETTNIKAFKYISDFLLALSILIIVLSIITSITTFSINFSNKKKDIKALYNIGIYKSKILLLLSYEPFINVLYCSLLAVISTILVKVLISVLYKELSNMNLPINISITFLFLLFFLPFLVIIPLILIKTIKFYYTSLKK